MKHIITLLATLLLVPLAALPAAEKKSDKPNVIVILTDDLGYDDVGCYWTPDNRPGFEKIQTPNIDRLAAVCAGDRHFVWLCVRSLPAKSAETSLCVRRWPPVTIEQLRVSL
jgi:arylsulfatase A